jgi:hypothetical protein
MSHFEHPWSTLRFRIPASGNRLPRAEPALHRKDKLIDFLKKEGQSEKAQRLEAELPEKVDHELHSDVLEKHGVNPRELISKIKF